MKNETCSSAVVAKSGQIYMIYLTSRLFILEVLATVYIYKRSTEFEDIMYWIYEL